MSTEDGLGPWEVWGPEKGYKSRPFWKLVRDNRRWIYGQEMLMTPKSGDARRFYTEDKALAEAAKLNAPAPIKRPF